MPPAGIKLIKQQRIRGPLIYMLTFPNGKRYVGQTLQVFDHRLSQHKLSATGKTSGCRLLKAAIKKYGWTSIKKY